MSINRHLSAYLTVFLFILFSGGIIPSALAATVAGKVAIVRGKVTALSEDGQTRTLAAKAPIHVNDTISTEANSQAQILFNDETVYTLGPQSDLKIDKFVYDPQKGVGDLVVGATKGSFRMITGSIAKKTPERVKVKTPVATIGIRGTYFAGTFNGAVLNALLVGGAITLENQGGVKNITTPGFGSLVKSGSAAPEPPRKYTPQEVKQVLAPTEIKMAPAPVAPQTAGPGPMPTGDPNAPTPQSGPVPIPKPDQPPMPPGPPPPPPTCDGCFPPPPPPPPPLPPPPPPSTSGTLEPPTHGIGVYQGTTSYTGGVAQSGVEDFKLYINWGTGKVFGSAGASVGEQVFFKGFVDRANKQISGDMVGKLKWGAPSAYIISSAPTVINFTGTTLQGISGAGSGTENLYTGAIANNWSSSISAAGNAVQYHLLRPAVETVETYKGFVAAVSIPRSTGLSDLTLLMNTSPNDVILSLDRNASTVDGSFSNVIGTSIGGTPKTHDLDFSFAPGSSFYIDDDAMLNTSLTTLGSSTVSGLAPVSNATGVNFVGTNPNLWNPIPYDHLTWGYWGAEYTAGGGGSPPQYSITPGSYWIAGLLTPNVNLPATGTGTYNGLAMGQAYSAGTGLYSITGTSSLTADFTNHKITNGLLTMSNNGGSMNWVVTLANPLNPITWSTTANAVGFSGTAVNATVNGTALGGFSGAVNGAFYETKLGQGKAVGGNWQVSGAVGGTNHYATGIFVGK